MLAGVGYVISSFTTLLLPQYAPLVSQVVAPLQFGELPIIFWLLVRGAKTSPGDVAIAANLRASSS